MQRSFLPDDDIMLGSDEYDIDEDLLPADFVVDRHLQDPLVAQEIMGMIQDAELMGIDLDDPELMGAWLKNLVNRIKTAVKKRRAARKAKGEPAPSISLSTARGTGTLGPGGVSWTDQAALQQSMLSPSTSTNLSELIKNPLVLGGVAALVLLIVMKRGKK